VSRPRVDICMPLKQPYPRVYTHRLHFGPRVAYCPEATHVCIVRAHVPLPRTHAPAPPHTLSHPLHPISLLLDVQRLSSVVSQASGMGHQAGLVRSLPAPHGMYLSPDAASMQTQAAGHRDARSQQLSSLCRTTVHSARTPTTRPLPRPAAIASRHATSRAMQVTSLPCCSRRLLLPPSLHHTAHVSLWCIYKPTCKALPCHTHRER
jgi:hypothetical protein